VINKILTVVHCLITIAFIIYIKPIYHYQAEILHIAGGWKEYLLGALVFIQAFSMIETCIMAMEANFRKQ